MMRTITIPQGHSRSIADVPLRTSAPASLDTIYFIRAIAAVVIIIVHATDAMHIAWIDALPLRAAVDIFFVLSGFLMMVSTRNHCSKSGSSKAFLVRRATRLIPLYWLCTTLVLVMNVQSVTMLDALRSYLFIPYYTPAPTTLMSYLPTYGLGWTLNYEIFFYILFAGTLRFSRTRAMFILTLCVAWIVGLGMMFPLPHSAWEFWTQPILFEFVLGAWIGWLWLRGVRMPANAQGMLCLLALMLWGCSTLWMNDPIHRGTFGWMRLLCWGLPASLLLIACTLRTSSAPSVSIGRSLGITLGKSSYALYLLHPFVQHSTQRLWAVAGCDIQNTLLLYVTTVLMLSCGLAVVVHCLVELPLTRITQRQLERIFR